MKRQTLLDVSAGRFIALVEALSSEKELKPYFLCGISKATFHRWKNGTTPIPLEKATRIAQKYSIDERGFLSKESITESFLLARRDELLRFRLLYKHYVTENDKVGSSDCLFGTARIIQARLTVAGYASLLLCEAPPGDTQTTIRITITDPRTDAVYHISIFGEGGEMYAVLENDDLTPIVGLNISNKNIRKILSIVGRAKKPEEDGLNALDLMAAQLITSPYGRRASQP